jgi:hypothetical protein
MPRMHGRLRRLHGLMVIRNRHAIAFLLPLRTLAVGWRLNGANRLFHTPKIHIKQQPLPRLDQGQRQQRTQPSVAQAQPPRLADALRR